MNFSELVENRTSVRKYLSTPVEDSTVIEILRAANRAPSAGNLQALKIFVVNDAQTRARLAAAALHQEHVATAPFVLIFFSDPKRSAQKYGKRGKELYSRQDATIACAYAQLAAFDMGLGVCWVGAFDEDKVRAAVAAPPSLIPVALLTIGYPAEDSAPARRRSLDDLVIMGRA